MQWPDKDRRNVGMGWFHFVPRISTGDLITTLGVIVAVIFGWAKFDTRISRLEDIATRQVTLDEKQDKSLTETRGEIKEELKEIKAEIRNIRR